MDISIFENMSDDDFFSNKLTHIYFNEDVTNESIERLITSINKANEIIHMEDGTVLEPKPILIHISSHGGHMTAGMRLFSVFALSRIPIATIIDNYSCSAATYLSINSPYRLINNYGYCLIHGYTISGKIKKKQKDLHNMIKTYDTYFKKIIDIYLLKTKFKHDELVELLQHDLILDANFCLEKGIVDRIIKINKKVNKKGVLKDISEIMKTPNNNIIISCNEKLSLLDKKLFQENLMPVIIHPKNNNCNSKRENNIETTIFETLNMIPRIMNIKAPTYAIIDSPISIDDLLPILYCDYIFMFDYAYIVSNILHFYNKSSLLLNDNIKNTELIFNIVTDILKEKTKMTDEKINDIKSKYNIIDANEAKKLGLCNIIISNQKFQN
jgi:ATP-dependent protease ClpP protease subunit